MFLHSWDRELLDREFTTPGALMYSSVGKKNTPEPANRIQDIFSGWIFLVPVAVEEAEVIAY